MKKELNVLRSIDCDGNTTQRDIAKLTGMSLGNVNSAIKSLIIKGYLRKYINSERDIKYLLTEEGKRSKSIALLDKYSEILNLSLIFRKKTETVISLHYKEKGLTPILYGDDDEIKKYLIDTMKNMDVAYRERKIADFADIIYNKESDIILLWHPDLENVLKDKGFNYINIISELEKVSSEDTWT